MDASGFPLSEMIYFVCPGALLLSALFNLAYHAWAEPWGAMGSSEKWTLQQRIPKPKSNIITKVILTPESDVPLSEKDG